MSDESEQPAKPGAVPRGIPITLKVSGDFSFPMNGDVRGLLARYAKGERTFVVDLSGVEELDSSALGMLLQLRDHSRDGQGVTLVNPSPSVRAVLGEAEIGDLFLLEDH